MVGRCVWLAVFAIEHVTHDFAALGVGFGEGFALEAVEPALEAASASASGVLHSGQRLA